MKKIFWLCTLFIMTEFACKKTENSPIDKESIEKEISLSGGNISLPGVASVDFVQGTFSNNVKVKLSKTKSQDVREDMQNVSLLYDIIEEFNYEIRINTKLLPDKMIKVTIDVPDSFISRVSGDYGLNAYGKFNFSDSLESIQAFNVLDTKFYGNRKNLEVELSPLYFSNKWTSDQSFEVIITIGISLGKNPSVGGIMKNCCDDSKLTCPLDNCVVSREFSSVPVTWPMDPNIKKPHRGVDYKGITGEPVYAAHNGEVIEVGNHGSTGWGKYIVIRHKTPTCYYKTLYGHLSRQLVTEEQKVFRGDKIGEVGQTGGATGPHLHFEYYKINSPSPSGSKFDTRDPLQCIVPYSKVRIVIPVCVSGCLGFVGIGREYRYKLYDEATTNIVLDTTIKVTNFVPYPACTTPTPDLLEIRLPAGTYVAELRYGNIVYTGFFGSRFQVVPGLNPCQYVIIS